MSRLLPALCLLATCLFAPLAAQASDPTLAGFGGSTAAPVGEPLQLPQGVEVAGPIKGHSIFASENCPPEPEAIKGSGGMVQLCLPLRYTPPPGAPPQTPIAVELPPGLIFISDELSTQNGILVKKVRVRIRPGEIVYLPLALMCMNDTRAISGPGSPYRLGPVTNNAAFRRLFAMLETKKLSSTSFEGDGVDVAHVQAAVWALSSGQPLSPETRAAIDALPNE